MIKKTKWRQIPSGNQVNPKQIVRTMAQMSASGRPSWMSSRIRHANSLMLIILRLRNFCLVTNSSLFRHIKSLNVNAFIISSHVSRGSWAKYCAFWPTHRQAHMVSCLCVLLFVCLSVGLSVCHRGFVARACFSDINWPTISQGQLEHQRPKQSRPKEAYARFLRVPTSGDKVEHSSSGQVDHE